jgi:hypothetical protein
MILLKAGAIPDIVPANAGILFHQMTSLRLRARYIALSQSRTSGLSLPLARIRRQLNFRTGETPQRYWRTSLNRLHEQIFSELARAARTV